MKLTNPWIGYFDRTYDKIKSAVLTNLGVNVPEITDHNETNPWVKAISIWSGVAEMLGYYQDYNAREAFIVTAQEFASAVKLAKGYDYRVKGAVPAGVGLRFTSSIPASADIIIPIGTVVKTADNLQFMTTTVGTITAGSTFVDVSAKQWNKVLNLSLGNSNGSADQIFVLESGVVDNSVAFSVNGVAWTAKDTLAYSFNNSQDFVAGLNEDAKMTIHTGDNENGKIPTNALPLTTTYYLTSGADGNIGAGKINTIVSVIAVPGAEVLSVNNLLSATGGASAEDLRKLAKRIPFSIRTRYRAVTDDDFIQVTEIFAGVEKAGVNFNCDVDRYVHVYVVPEGGGLAAPSLLADVAAFLETRKIITTLIQVGAAGVVGLKVTVSVIALPGYSNAQVGVNVSDALVAFGSAENQEIRGSAIIGDIYQAIEEAAGVLNSDISIIVAIPYARNLTAPANVLNWTRAIQPASVNTLKWLIRFTTVSQYELFKGVDFIGNFNVDTDVMQTEILFRVIGNHVAGNDYEFYTYPYDRSIILQEASVISVNSADLTINISGGV